MFSAMIMDAKSDCKLFPEFERLFENPTLSRIINIYKFHIQAVSFGKPLT